MNMGFWVPEANFYRQSSFLVSCQFIAWTSSQLCPGHSKADTAKNRIWDWGRNKTSEGRSEVYVKYILFYCVQSWGNALPSHSSQWEWKAHIWENMLGFEGIQEHIKQQGQKQNRERAEDKEAWTWLRKGRSEWTAPDLPGHSQTHQPCLDCQHRFSVLKAFYSAKVSIKATFIRQQAKPWTKLLEAC